MIPTRALLEPAFVELLRADPEFQRLDERAVADAGAVAEVVEMLDHERARAARSAEACDQRERELRDQYERGATRQPTAAGDSSRSAPTGPRLGGGGPSPRGDR